MTDKTDKIRIAAITIAVILVATAILSFKYDLPRRVVRKIKSLAAKDVTVHEEKIDIEGLEEEFTIIFVADSHICLCDDRDKEVKETLESRYNEFVRDSKGSEKNFSILMDYVRKENPDLVIFGGDMTDEATYASIEYVENEISKLQCPYLYVMGNHDFMYGNEYFSEKAYSEYLPRLDAVNPDKEGYEIVSFDKFNILLLDDYDNQVCPESVKAIETLKEDGRPVIVAQHVPFVPTYGESDLIERTNDLWGSAYMDYSRVLMGEHANKPNEATQTMIDFVSEENGCAKVILAGHVHFDHKDYMSSDTVQLTVKPAFERGLTKLILY